MTRCHATLAWIVLGLTSTLAFAESLPGPRQQPDALLAIDQSRATVVDRILMQWGDQLATSSAAVKPDQLRTILTGLRADHLLAASLAGTLDGLRNVLAVGVTSPAPLRDGLVQTKALGDTSDDVVYTPVTPCRLVETRPGTFAAVYQGAGAFAPNEIRNYAIQGGNGVCLSQLPAGLNPTAVQLQVFAIPVAGASGDIEILPQGAAFDSTTTEVYLGTELITSASTTARINLANNQVGVKVRGGGTNLAIDVVGYFKAPSGGYFAQGGNTFATTAKLGTLDNQPLEIYVNNSRAMRYEGSNVVGGVSTNSANPNLGGQTIAGGGLLATCSEGGTTRTCANQSTKSFATIGGGIGNAANGENTSVGGGFLNTASGYSATVSGGAGNTASGQWATVAGGQDNMAGGDYSFAAGKQATIPDTAPGSFLWSDSTGPVSLPANAHDEFIVVSTNGIGMYTFKDFSHGCALIGAAGSWTCTSDRATKSDFTAIEPGDVLARLVAMPIMQWRWKGEADTVRHMGPTAQDFRAAFGLGYDDKTIALVDSEGVALAAVQGLHEVVRQKEARITALEIKLESQQRELEHIRRTMEAVLSKTGSQITAAAAR